MWRVEVMAKKAKKTAEEAPAVEGGKERGKVKLVNEWLAADPKRQKLKANKIVEAPNGLHAGKDFKTSDVYNARPKSKKKGKKKTPVNGRPPTTAMPAPGLTAQERKAFDDAMRILGMAKMREMAGS